MNDKLAVSVTAEGDWSYPQAAAVLQALREHSIECGVTDGGIWMTIDIEVHGNTVVRIIRENCGSFCRKTALMRQVESLADQRSRDQCLAIIKKMYEA